MRRRSLGALLLAATTVITDPSSVSAQEHGLAVVGATIYPSPDRPPIRDGVVLLRNGRIEAVGRRTEITLPHGTPTLDAVGMSVVAGFWNSHVHFTGHEFAGADTIAASRLTAALGDMLTRWGFTSVFDTGSELENTLAIRRRIALDTVQGPRIFTTGDILFPEGVTFGRSRLSTPAQAQAMSTRLLDGGADAVKVYAQTFWDLTLKLSPEVLRTVVTTAHRHQAQVFAHPSNREGLVNSIDAGVDQLMHTTPQIGPWGAALVKRMKAANVALVPTLTLWRFELAREKVPPPGIAAFQGRGIAQLGEYFRAGGAILFGTDVGYMTDFDTREEFEKMAEAGMAYRDILASLTTVPAGRRGLAGSTGQVARGFDADLVVLRGDPAIRISAFSDVAYTVRGGRVIFRAYLR